MWNQSCSFCLKMCWNYSETRTHGAFSRGWPKVNQAWGVPLWVYLPGLRSIWSAVWLQICPNLKSEWMDKVTFMSHSNSNGGQRFSFMKTSFVNVICKVVSILFIPQRAENIIFEADLCQSSLLSALKTPCRHQCLTNGKLIGFLWGNQWGQRKIGSWK